MVTPLIKIDALGDIYSEKYKSYFKSGEAANILAQLEENFMFAFDEEATPEKMRSAINFAYYLLAELGSDNLGERYANAARSVMAIVDSNSVVKTCENMASLRDNG
jgi:hypothetical protein